MLVFEAIKAWRMNRTTIVITHDLSQILPSDFVYVLRNGELVEQGYRSDLEQPQPDGSMGEFKHLMRVQDTQGGFPVKRESQIDEVVEGDEEVGRILEEEERENEVEVVKENKHLSVMGIPPQGSQGVGVSGWVLDVVSDLKRSKSTTNGKEKPAVPVRPPALKHLNLSAAATISSPTLSKHASMWTVKKKKRNTLRRHLSLQFTPTSAEMEQLPRPPSLFAPRLLVEDDDEFEQEKNAVKQSGLEANRRRAKRVDRSHRVDLSVVVESDNASVSSDDPKPKESTSFIKLLRAVYPTLPNKPVIITGLLISLLSGAMTPVFSFLLSRLLFEVSTGATRVHTINVFGGLVLAVAALDGVLIGLKFFVNESGGMGWITRLRKLAYSKFLSQDKSFFDAEGHGAPQVVQSLMKDGDDARNLVAVVLSQSVAVSAMLSVGLLWALATGWQLTLAGLAIGPVFAVTMSFQANLVAKAERNNKTAREEIAKGYYEASRSSSFTCLLQD